jgi:hypothetical protein
MPTAVKNITCTRRQKVRSRSAARTGPAPAATCWRGTTSDGRPARIVRHGTRQRQQQDDEQRRADHLVGVAPAVAIDQRLRERHDQQRPAAEARVGDADRGAEPALEPAADQRRRRHHADRGDAEAAEQADADVELPQRGHLRGEEVAAAEQRQAAGVEDARAPALEDHAAERRGEAAHDHQRE